MDPIAYIDVGSTILHMWIHAVYNNPLRYINSARICATIDELLSSLYVLSFVMESTGAYDGNACTLIKM